MSAPQQTPIDLHLETRQRLLDAGTRLFAEHGYRGVSVRELCTEAAVNIAAINYHFGGKQGLYHAIFEATLAADEPRFQELLRNTRLLLAGARGNREQLARVVQVFTTGMLTPANSDERSRSFGVLVIRELAFPSTEFEIIFQRRAQPCHQMFAKIIAAASGLAEDSEQVRIETHALVGMIFHIGLSRTILWRTMDWEGTTPDRAARVGDFVAQLICNALCLPVVYAGFAAGEKK
ncbi:MAG: CerR family C-terminal domain-containing protein [Gammaproteobacteria bacterium]|nr:CerR family C-terminal domain-containing protein [Gammaproteobacteria bacterium]